jgi:hypothetical protein
MRGRHPYTQGRKCECGHPIADWNKTGKCKLCRPRGRRHQPNDRKEKPKMTGEYMRCHYRGGELGRQCNRWFERERGQHSIIAYCKIHRNCVEVKDYDSGEGYTRAASLYLFKVR